MNSCALILTRTKNDYVSYLDKNLNIDTFIISDDSIDDHLVKETGFINMTTKKIKTPSAWDKAIFTINSKKLINQYDFFWFIEDDVFIKDLRIFDLLKRKVDELSPDLYAYRMFSKPIDILKTIYPGERNSKKYLLDYLNKNILYQQSFESICRISSLLLDKIIKFKNTYNSLHFHEELFSSLATYNKLNINMATQPMSKTFQFFSGFNMRQKPVISGRPGIYHPVKNNQIIHQ